MTETVSPAGSSRLTRFNAGVETFSVGVGASPAFQGVAVLNGNVLVADYAGFGAIQRFSPSGAYLGAFAVFDNPTFLESDSGGNVYTTHFSIGPAVATRFDSAGTVTQTFSLAGSTELAGIDADAAGNVYVVDSSGDKLAKFASNGMFLNSIPVGGNPGDVSIDEVGKRLYMTDEFGGVNGIKIFDISGVSPSFIGNFPTPAGTNLVGVHFAAESGNILATDFGAGSRDPRGLEFSPGGALLRTYRPASIGLAMDITTLPVPEPTALALLTMAILGFATNARRSR